MVLAMSIEKSPLQFAIGARLAASLSRRELSRVARSASSSATMSGQSSRRTSSPRQRAGCTRPSVAACSAWRPISVALAARATTVDARRRRSGDRAPRGARGSGACGPSRAPPRRASPPRNARARARASAAARLAARARRHLLALGRVPADRRVDHGASSCAHDAAHDREIALRHRARVRTVGRGARARAACARSPSRPRCRDRADARCPAARASWPGSGPQRCSSAFTSVPCQRPGAGMHDHARRLVDRRSARRPRRARRAADASGSATSARRRHLDRDRDRPARTR